MYHLLLASLLVATVSSQQLACDSTYNYVIDGGFESGFAPWVDDGSSYINQGVSDIAPHTGQNYYYTQTSTPNNLTQQLGTFSGYTYNVTFWIQELNSYGNVLVYWNGDIVYNATADQILAGGGYTTINGVNDYAPFSVSVNAIGNDILSFWLPNYGVPGTGSWNTARIDDVSAICLGTTTTPISCPRTGDALCQDTISGSACYPTVSQSCLTDQYDPSITRICTIPDQSCNGVCYDTNAYNCTNGQITQLNAGSSGSGAPIDPATFCPRTGDGFCNDTFTGPACYYLSSQNCSQDEYLANAFRICTMPDGLCNGVCYDTNAYYCDQYGNIAQIPIISDMFSDGSILSIFGSALGGSNLLATVFVGGQIATPIPSSSNSTFIAVYLPTSAKRSSLPTNVVVKVNGKSSPVFNPAVASSTTTSSTSTSSTSTTSSTGSSSTSSTTDSGSDTSDTSNGSDGSNDSNSSTTSTSSSGTAASTQPSSLQYNAGSILSPAAILSLSVVIYALL